ncbi:putative protein phosphatase 2 regulatory subunit b gamma [Monocercomonoides exilis]|uniref:putative protein phosphatase 2 regulatory subunit b gamma n=1 Tax=Monocercomonoides exilis TaxID=2049356 RepID=UPI003559DB93|nr:putative protein phosphatase 2 regulatory subunit b gamma [Monocercomonoides exilis]|eukprot:MONOS_1945.1-p1 / transcript=MONOS_1945.1 / gene=MONOS_1945 / organism=Monocercomonoides_exilis_PA203 / gene_product=protein phosphatase 2 regulatory subunit b gamma, putative / transcript_product=protein phosphatase 2 regulatory subunit b gamma, putative / location=Mono_scaffold00037:97512-99962(-) / protein_length=491 / sequence_SO=supercontig / SO=protein_coding / is_pseudo=false
MSLLQNEAQSTFESQQTKKKVDCGLLLDNLFTRKQSKKEVHKSFRYIPRLKVKQETRTKLEEEVKQEAKANFLNAKLKTILTTTELAELWTSLIEQAGKNEESNGRINYDEYLEVRNRMPPKIQTYFTPSLFLKLEKDEYGRISILTFFQFCVRKTSFFRAKITISVFDTTGTGVLTETNMDEYITEMAKSFPQLQRVDESVIQYYSVLGTRKFFFFLDPMRTQQISISSILASPILSEMLSMQEAEISEEDLVTNWFSPVNFHRIYENYLNLDIDGDGLLSLDELKRYARNSYAPVFISRVFQEFHTFQGKLDFKSYLTFILMIRYKSTPEALRLYFKLFDFQKRGYLTAYEVMYFVRDMVNQLPECGVGLTYIPEDIKDEVFDLARPAEPGKITANDLIRCRSGDTIVGMMTNCIRFYNYDQREFNAAGAKEHIEEIIPIPEEPMMDGAEGDMGQDGEMKDRDDFGGEEQREGDHNHLLDDTIHPDAEL